MQTFSRVLMLTGDDNGEPLPEKVLTALTPRFSLGAAGRARTARQTWLDTFDWRLHRAGLTAAHVTSTRPAELVLTGPAGEQVSQQAGRLRWPALPAVLPAGPVTGMLQEIAGIRALLPAAHTVTAEQELRILNPDAKTVAWVTLQRTAVTSPAAAQLPVRLEVTAVRGYQVQAERIAQILAAVPGVTELALAPLDAALAAAGRHPEDYSNKLSVPLVPHQPARLALRVLLLILLDTLQANVPGTIRGTDTEFLHDLRVSVRRTRSALKLVGNVLPGGLASRFAAEFKWLGDLTTPTRDLDVYLLNYQAITAGLVAAEPAELEPFRAHLDHRHAVEQRHLARGLRSARFTGLCREWRSALTGLSAPRGGGEPIAAVAADRLYHAHRRVLRQGRAITPDSPPERLHDLRKRCKELRYLLEFFASLYDPQAYQRAVKDLKGLQDCLGEFQDCEVQRHEIREFAGQMMASHQVPATALLAMGELAGQVGLRERRARQEFADRFGEFASLDSEQRFRALVGGGR